MSEPPPLIASNCGHDHGNGRDSTRVLDPDTRIPSFDDLSHVVSLQHSTDSFWENGYDRLETEASEIDVRLFPQIQFVSYKCTMGSLFLGFFPFLPSTFRVPMSSFGNMYATRSSLKDLIDRESPYNYVPTEWVCILFIALFGISTTSHIAQAVRYRLWWLFPTAVVSGIIELIGWSGRLWSSQNPLLRTPFLMQIATLIIAPTFLIATNFVILGKIIGFLGPQYCRMSQKKYTIVFLSVDIVALIVQSIGGGIASGTQPVLGGHIALGGIVLQFVALLFFTFISGEFLLRFTFDRPIRGAHQGVTNMRGVADGNIRLMILGLSAMTTFLLIRSMYRTVELSDGWTGVIISTQWLFNVLDGAMIVLAIFTLNILHPGMLLRRHDRVEAGISAEKFTGSTSVRSV